MLKKLSALLIALLLVSSFSLVSSAASAKISADTVYGNRGDSVTVIVKLDSNPGFACLRLFAEYDSTALELENHFDEGLMGVSSSKDLGNGKYCFSWGEKGERHIHYTKTGELVSLVFRITDKAKDAKYEIKLSYDKSFAEDNDGNPVDVNFTNGAVVVGKGGSLVSPSQADTTTIPSADKTNSVSSTQKSADKPVTSAPSVSQKNTQGAVQNSPDDSTTLKSGDTSTTAVRSTETAGTDNNGTVKYSPEAETVTDENGSAVPDATEPDQTDEAVAGTDTVETEPQPGSKLKMVIIIIIVVILAFALILLLFKSGRSKKSDN